GSTNGLTLNTGSAGSTIRGLVINRFTISAINVNTANNVIEGNFLGVDVSGSIARGNGGAGVSINADAAHNPVGGTTAGSGNIIAANTGNGIIVAAGADGAQIYGNFIGTNPGGTAGLGNGIGGVQIRDASNATIGSLTGSGRNVIASNGNNGTINTSFGVFVFSQTTSVSGTQIVNNYIGLAPDGTT